jgi:integrase/recombinase XerD
MSALRQSLDDYLKVRRALGFKLRTTEWCLRGFVDLLDAEGAKHITTELALRWARRPANGEPFTWAQRLSRIRQFAAWHRTRDPRTEVPAAGLLAASVRRKPPFIFSDEQIADIVREAAKLPSRRGMRACTFSTMFGLFAIAGLRISEAVALDRADVDLKERHLTVRDTKFGKTRLVPLSRSTVEALRRYAKQRDRTFPTATNPAFFLSESGRRVTSCATRYNFAKVSQATGLRAPVKGYRHGRGPRVHDLRHSFAARTMVAWYRAGLDVERELPKLSAYLGHAHVNDTYWYIEAVPELLQLATERITGKREEVCR